MGEFSAPQVAALRHGGSDETLFAAIGSVRSGKTWSVGISFALWLSMLTESYDHSILAASVEVAMRNVGFDFLSHVHALGGSAEVSKVYGTCIHVAYPGKPEQKVWIVGASDERSRKRLQGATLAGLLVEELPILPEAAWDFAWSRLSVTGAKCWITGNPEGPANFAKRKVVDRIDAFHGRHQTFLLRDNPSLDEKTIQRYESSFTGFQYERLIRGLWAAASGACWPKWQTVDQDPPKDFTRLTLGLDWATSGVLGVLAVRSPREMDKAVVTHELRRDGGKEGLLTDAEFAKRVAAWCEGEVGSSPQGALIVHDPSMPTDAERALRYYGFRLQAGRNDVAPGIMRTGSVLGEGRLLIHERCRHLRDEMASYVWDEKKALIGEDAPVKAADHLCDALRYIVYTLWKLAPVGPMTRPMPMSIRLKGF